MKEPAADFSAARLLSSKNIFHAAMAKVFAHKRRTPLPRARLRQNHVSSLARTAPLAEFMWN
jgi:hypothetical protein